MKTKQTCQKKGASPRKLNERELAKELRRADLIIANAYNKLSISDRAVLAYQQSKQGITKADDPMGQGTRLTALHRITPKPDYLKVLLIILCVLFGLAWYASQTENELLQTELSEYSAKSVSQ